MSRAATVLRLPAATLAVSPLLLAGCVVLNVDRPKQSTAPLPSRPGLVVGSVAQLRYGNGAPYEVCVANACPKPTHKTLASATRTSQTDAIAPVAEAPTIAAIPFAPPAPVVQARAIAAAVEPGSTTVMIAFGSGAASLSPAARKTLDALAREARPVDTIEIRGRTDELGSAQLNEALARNRALAVRDYLRQARIPEDTLIRVSSKGACCYIAGNDTAEGRAANRRVEIELKPRTQLSLGSTRNEL